MTKEELVADAESPSERPRLLLVRSDATPEEIAAVVAVLAARAASNVADQPPPPRSNWADPRQALRQAPAAGPGAWARSGFEPGVRTRADW